VELIERLVADQRQGGRPRLALIAHDAKKDDLLRLLQAHRRMLSEFRLVATRTTGRSLAASMDLDIELVSSGPMGALQIGARIAEGDVDALVFLRDPLTAHPHEPDIQALLKVCDVHQVPVATNLASAEILLHAFASSRHELDIALAAEGTR